MKKLFYLILLLVPFNSNAIVIKIDASSFPGSDNVIKGYWSTDYDNPPITFSFSDPVTRVGFYLIAAGIDSYPVISAYLKGGLIGRASFDKYSSFVSNIGIFGIPSGDLGDAPLLGIYSGGGIDQVTIYGDGLGTGTINIANITYGGSPVPIPPSILLLASGFSLLMLRRI